MSGTPTPGFQRRPRRPLASGSFAAATGVRMLKTQKQGTPDGVTRHFAPASLWRPATHLPGSDSWSGSEPGKRLTRVPPGLCQRAAAGSRGGPGAGPEGGKGSQCAKAPEGKGRRRRARGVRRARGGGPSSRLRRSGASAQPRARTWLAARRRGGGGHGEVRLEALRDGGSGLEPLERDKKEGRTARCGGGSGSGCGSRRPGRRGMGAGGRRPATSRCRGGRGVTRKVPPPDPTAPPPDPAGPAPRASRVSRAVSDSAFLCLQRGASPGCGQPLCHAPRRVCT